MTVPARADDRPSEPHPARCGTCGVWYGPNGCGCTARADDDHRDAPVIATDSTLLADWIATLQRAALMMTEVRIQAPWVLNIAPGVEHELAHMLATVRATRSVTIDDKFGAVTHVRDWR